jgi:soluble lytic murein transglycosylase-like protein
VALSARGFYKGPIDAIAGPAMRRAVVRFQRSRGLRVDGVAGPQTRQALGRLGRPLYGRRILRRGMVGWDVSVLQFLLRRSTSAAGPIDGRFGLRTRSAMLRFQRQVGLAPDGVVGPRTRRALAAVSPEAVRRGLNRWARRYGISPELVRSLAWVESGHQPQAVSSAGARGVMLMALLGRATPAWSLAAGLRATEPACISRCG